MKPLISVIVPIYKVEKYLTICVDSLLRQSYGNLEIILVDDGSPDECPAICDQYQNKDNRIKVIHKKNGGLSDARNAGLDIAQESMWRSLIQMILLMRIISVNCMMHYSRIGHQLQFAEFK